MYGKDYGHAGTMSSSGDKMEFKKGGSDTRSRYEKDMYDSMVDLRSHGYMQGKVDTGKNTKATKDPTNSIQGTASASSDGNTGDRSKAANPSDLGSGKHYGEKGNPYADKSDGKGGAQGPTSGKPVSEMKQVVKPGKKPKMVVKSIADLRSVAEAMKS